MVFWLKLVHGQLVQSFPMSIHVVAAACGNVQHVSSVLLPALNCRLGGVVRRSRVKPLARLETSHTLSIPTISTSRLRALPYVSPRLGFLRALKGVLINDTASRLAFLHCHSFDDMILQKYSRFVDGTIPVAALLYDDEENYASQDGVGIYDG